MIRADKWPRAGIGRTGWHIDGSFQEKPFAYSIYHIISVPEVGATVFAPLSEVLEAIPAATRAQWERLHMVGKGGRVVHPLVYAHPSTGTVSHAGCTESPSTQLTTQAPAATYQRHAYGARERMLIYFTATRSHADPRAPQSQCSTLPHQASCTELTPGFC